MIEVKIKDEVASKYVLQSDWFIIPLSFELDQRRFLFKDYDFRIGDKVYTRSSEEFIKQFNKYRVWDRLQQ